MVRLTRFGNLRDVRAETEVPRLDLKLTSVSFIYLIPCWQLIKRSDESNKFICLNTLQHRPIRSGQQAAEVHPDRRMELSFLNDEEYFNVVIKHSWLRRLECSW